MVEEEKKGKDEANKCPKCDSELHHVEKLGEHYCFSCETYYPQNEVDKAKAKAQEEAAKKAQVVADAGKEERAKPKGIPCPSCGDMTAPVKDSDSYYCYSCEKYYTKGGKVVEEKAEDAPKTAAVEVKPVEVEKEEKAEVASLAPKAEIASVRRKTDDFKIELTADESIILDLLEGNKTKEDKRVCPTCGLALTYVQKYDRWYCYTCRKYATKGAPSEEEKSEEAMKCSDCGGDADYILKYDRWYCKSCKKYLPAGVKEDKKAAVAAVEEEAAQPLCAVCGKPTTWVATYERYYCYPCKKYHPKAGEKAVEKPAPEAVKPAAEAARPAMDTAKPAAEAAKATTTAKPSGPACVSCGRPTSWIPKYNRHYCYHCQKYVPKAESKVEEKPSEEKASTPKCPTCGKPTNWIAKYERYYCYPCKKYVPK